MLKMKGLSGMLIESQIAEGPKYVWSKVKVGFQFNW